MALLEQNRARAAAATEDDDELEQAFIEAHPRKRTREDIIAELKNKRHKSEGASELEGATGEGADEQDATLEEAKKAGKFRPIGFKPIGNAEGKKKKKVKKKKDIATASVLSNKFCYIYKSKIYNTNNCY